MSTFITLEKYQISKLIDYFWCLKIVLIHHVTIHVICHSTYIINFPSVFEHFAKFLYENWSLSFVSTTGVT